MRSESCHACNNAGYLHMLGMGSGEEVVIPCPECKHGKRFASFLRKETSSPPTEFKSSQVDAEGHANDDIAEEVQPYKDDSISSRIHTEE